jgi:hypothetical protein
MILDRSRAEAQRDLLLQFVRSLPPDSMWHEAASRVLMRVGEIGEREPTPDARKIAWKALGYTWEIGGENVDRIARAIYNAPNGLDGDQIADMLYTDDRMPDTREEALIATFDVCRQAARAAIAAMPRAEALAVAVAALEEIREGRVAVSLDFVQEFARLTLAAIEAAAPPSKLSPKGEPS